MNNENNNQNEQKFNLLTRLRTTLKTTKVVKKIAGLVIASTIAFTTFACTSNENSTNSNHSNSSQISTSEGLGSTNQNSKYSEMLNNIMYKEYYKYMLEKAREDKDVYNSAAFDPHPYGFLEDEGFDINAIKSGEVYCRTQSFIKNNEPNNLYIATYVKNNEKNYYTQYMLRYKLTDQERKEYDYLHYHDDGKFNIQAVFLNQEISLLKEPEVLCENKIDVEALLNMRDAFESWATYLGGATCDLILKDCSVEDNEFSLYAMPRLNHLQRMCSNGKVGVIYLIGDSQQVTLSEGIFIKPSKFGPFDTKPNANNDPAEEAVFYHPQSTDLTLQYCESTVDIK